MLLYDLNLVTGSERQRPSHGAAHVRQNLARSAGKQTIFPHNVRRPRSLVPVIGSKQLMSGIKETASRR